jgi:tRNA threonylcarbamoyladenosine biosynthesis protein TsaB
MTKLLAVETSGTACSVAVHADGIWIEDTQNVPRLHNQVLLGQIDRVVRRASVSARAFDVIAFGAGPASFTGVRIAAATAQALALACDALVVPVPSSLALAETARSMPALADAPGVVTVTRSRRDAHYLAAWAFTADGCRQVLGDVLHQGVDRPSLDTVQDWPGVGDRPPWWQAAPPFLEGVVATAGVIGRLALALRAAGAAVAPEAALPIYVTGDSPWRPQTGPTTPAQPPPGAG